MQIVTDTGTDYPLACDYRPNNLVHIIPLNVQLDNTSYRDGEDASREKFYQDLASSPDLPTTSQPSAGQFARLYGELAKKDPDILSIHLSSGLSGTIQSAQAGARLVPEARVTIVDTKTLSIGSGWQVDAAVRAIRAKWPKERILDLLAKISAATHSFYTLNELKYLIHGGRISHLKGLLASLLQIKPMIGVNHESGQYAQVGQARTFQGALKGLVNIVTGIVPAGSPIRIQVVHTQNPEGADQLHALIDPIFKCTWLKKGPISYVLGAHTGPSMVGICFAPLAAFSDLP